MRSCEAGASVSSAYSLCKQWTVLLFRALTLVVLLLLQWPVLFAIAGATPVMFVTFVFVL
jgi:hypothetical protein